MEDLIAMFFKKSGKKESFTVTHKSQQTTVSINGQEVTMGDAGVDVDMISLLKSQGIDTDAIPEAMLAELASTMNGEVTTGATTLSSDANVKVDCDSCNRTVSFGKGSCMYCGNTLQLSPAKGEIRASNEVDEKFLNSDATANKGTVTKADINYVDRLKDL